MSYGLLTFEIHRGTVISDAFLLYGLDFTSVTFTLILLFVLYISQRKSPCLNSHITLVIDFLTLLPLAGRLCLSVLS